MKRHSTDEPPPAPGRPFPPSFSVFDHLPVLVSLRAPDYRVAYANRLFSERFGDPGRRPCYAFFYGRSKPCRPCLPARVFRSGRPAFGDWLGAPDGRSYRLQEIPFQEKGGDFVLEVGLELNGPGRGDFGRDFGGEPCGDVQRACRLGTWEWDLSSGRILLSEEALHLLGLTSSEFDGRFGSFLERVHPADRERVRRRILKAIERRLPLPVQGRIRRGDGAEWIFELRGRAVDELVRIRGTIQDITERKVMEREIRAALAEKEVLLREVHHRVKNNFQVVISLLRLQCDAVSDELARMAISDAEARIRAMATVHEKLYRSASMAFIDARVFLETLIGELSRAWQGRRIPVRTEIERLPLKADAAVPCGLILNELLTNVFKHAFPEDAPGSAFVGLRRLASEKTAAPAGLELTVGDDGIGLPPGVAPGRGTRLGLQLVHALATRQLGGEVSVEPRDGGGTWVRVRFVHEVERPSAGKKSVSGRRRRAARVSSASGSGG